MEVRPADDLGGGASTTFRHPAFAVTDLSRLVGYVTQSGLSERSGENAGTGATAGLVPWIRQQEGFILMPGIAPSFAISPQQEGRASACIRSTQAEAGIAVHETTTASISNASFLPQGMIVVSQFHL